ncbi:MAG: GspH/FimT family pseudopilin [Acidobacteriota bacterium]|jgi:prepilin-type N-terminal cleavage/methylation domain-containing protein|nr:GspH/FimT family pseudopilin [Acidobacteriota bacterium]
MGRRTPGRPGDRLDADAVPAGFSLLELLLVIAIASAMATAAVPGLARMQQGWALWSGARMVEMSLQWGRMRAVAANAPVMFEVAGDGRSFVWKDPESGDGYAATGRVLGGGVRIVASPARPLRFYPRGNAAPSGTYKVAGAAGSYSVVVAPGGRVRVQKD